MMQLWIRSQDRECVMLVDRLDIDGKKIQANGFYMVMGEYKSYERALEVLDEIQEFRDSLILLDNLPQKEKKQMLQEIIKNDESLTYFMPEE